MSKISLLFQFHPDKYTDQIEEMAEYANIENYEQATISLGLLGMMVIGILAYLLPYTFMYRAAFFLLIGPLSYLVTPYMALSVSAERRRQEMERMLPDAFLLISTNLKSGASINQAFLASAREEFGPLEEELRRTAIEISGGTPVEEALDNLRHRVNSGLFKDTLKILSNAIESGGNTAELLESSADDIRSSLELREEIKSSVRMYVIFILLASVFGAPALFGITTYMADTTTQMWEQTNIQSANSFMSGGTGLQFQQPDINTDFLVQFSIAALTISNFFASLIISQIGNGNMREGAKYIPFTVSISVGLFMAIRAVLSTTL